MEIRRMQKKVDMQRKKNKITHHERQEALKNIDILKDMMEKKEKQIALHR